MGIRRVTTENEAAALADLLNGLEVERAQLARDNARYRRTIDHRESELKQLKSHLRKTKQSRSARLDSLEFADAEQGFRHAVVTAWARRTPAAEQAARSLPNFRISPEFLAKVQSLEGISLEKVADVTFEIVTGLARELTSREVHQMRVSEAGGAPVVRRPADGATAWRAALQRNTPGARRIHYWQLSGGEIELWYVGVHDDVRTP